MRLIVGLGNPGKEYEQTRHNVGFWAIDALQQAYRIPLQLSNTLAYTGCGRIAGVEVLLVKPLTFMNRSGVAVQKLLTTYQSGAYDLILLHDDIDLPPGKIRVKWRGGDAGHKGVRSVMEHLETDEFLRIRIGVGRPSGGEDVSAYVLSPFTEEERRIIEQVIGEQVVTSIVAILQGKVRDPKPQENLPGCQETKTR